MRPRKNGFKVSTPSFSRSIAGQPVLYKPVLYKKVSRRR